MSADRASLLQTAPAGPGLKRAPVSLQVVRSPRNAMLAREVDWSSWYLTDEADIGQSPQHHHLAAMFESIVRTHAAERGWTGTLVGGDAFFAWVPEHPLVRVSPDVYTVSEPPDPLPKAFHMWTPGHRPPRFALEIVSEAWRKDYHDNPPKYAQLGVAELVIFDPEGDRARSRERTPLQLFRRAADGVFVRVYVGPGPVYSDELEGWLVVVGAGASSTLRLALDAAGQRLVPTEAERAELERTAKEQERSARLAAEAEVARLREELARLRAG